MRIEAEVQRQLLDAGPWKLSIHALAMNGSGSGLVRVELPRVQPGQAPHLMDGSLAEKRFLEITGAMRPEKQTDGDAAFWHNGAWRYVEIKLTRSSGINQVRAIKFIPLVVLDLKGKRPRWLVIPGSDIVDIQCRKPRGQHSECPFESAGLTLTKLERFVIREPLTDAVLRAFEVDDKNPELQALMSGVLHELRDLTHRSCTEAKRIIMRKGGLMPRRLDP